MVSTPHLEVEHVEQNSSGKHTIISEAFDDFDGAIAASVDIDVESSNHTLTSEEALRNLVVVATGYPGTNRTITAPDNNKLYVIKNETDGAVTFKTASGSGVQVAVGKTAICYCDGVNVISLSSVIAALSDIANVNAGSASDNDLIRWVAGSNEWQSVSIATLLALASIGALSDVDLSGAQDGDVLRRSGGNWIPDSAGAAPTQLLDDVGDGATTEFTLSAQPAGSLLVWVGGNLLNETDDWSVAGTTLTFVSPPAYGASIYAWDFGSNDATVTAPYDLSVFLPGQYGDGELLVQIVFDRNVDYPADFSGSQTFALTAANGETVLDVQKNGSSIGSITFAAAGQTATFSLSGGASFAAGDRLSIINENPADANLADVSITLKGTRKP